MDQIDARILKSLQADSSGTIAQLADQVGLSLSACHRRIKILEKEGFITGYGATLSREALGLAVEVFVEISLHSQSVAALEAFETAVNKTEEILECHLTAGNADYLLRLAARDIGQFEQIHRTRLAELPGVASMRTTFALKAVKSWHGVPVPNRARS